MDMDLNNEGWSKILKIYPEMDFTKELEENDQLSKYLRDAINKNSLGLENPLEEPDCPKLDDDFSKMILMNGLPKCDEKKASRFTTLLIKLFSKKNFTITEEHIEYNYDESGMTTG